MKIEEIIYDHRYEYNDVETNFDSDQIRRVIMLLENVQKNSPEDMELVIAIMKVLNEASGNEVGYHNFEIIISKLEEKYC